MAKPIIYIDPGHGGQDSGAVGHCKEVISTRNLNKKEFTITVKVVYLI